MSETSFTTPLPPYEFASIDKFVISPPETSQLAIGPYVAMAAVGSALYAWTAVCREALVVKVPGGDGGGDGGGEGGGGEGSGCEGNGGKGGGEGGYGEGGGEAVFGCLGGIEGGIKGGGVGNDGGAGGCGAHDCRTHTVMESMPVTDGLEDGLRSAQYASLTRLLPASSVKAMLGVSTQPVVHSKTKV